MIFKKKENKKPKEEKKNLHDLIIQPVITEKATQSSSFSQVILSVPMDANKKKIKSAVESIFGVNVKKINMIISKGKTKKFKGRKGKRKDQKKAIISLEKGQKIDITTGI